MAGIAGAAEKKLERYQEAIEKIVDEDQAKAVDEEVAKQEMKEACDISTPGEIMPCSVHGPDLVFEPLTGRFFRSERELIRSAINDFNHDLIDVVWMDLNEWCAYLGVPGCGAGDMVGWNSDRLLDVRISSVVAPNGEPALALMYNTMPTVTFKY